MGHKKCHKKSSSSSSSSDCESPSIPLPNIFISPGGNTVPTPLPIPGTGVNLTLTARSFTIGALSGFDASGTPVAVTTVSDILQVLVPGVVGGTATLTGSIPTGAQLVSGRFNVPPVLVGGSPSEILIPSNGLSVGIVAGNAELTIPSSTVASGDGILATSNLTNLGILSGAVSAANFASGVTVTLYFASA